MNPELEESAQLQLDFTKLQRVVKSGYAVLPVVVQDAESKEVIIVAYANEEALRYSLEHKIATFWSTSRGELWIKGKTSGDELELVEVRVNCEQNSLLYLVKLKGQGSCHTKGSDGKSRFGCYYRKIEAGLLSFLPGRK